ncbi:hypothetical protein G6F42_013888 [Rhizopus arrhizus]|nr:hypothetical protein G6F42_013888 [Rhizopus arrhizus]
MPNFLPTSSGMGKNPYTAQTSQASSSVSLQDLNQRIVTPPQHTDSWDSLHNEDLPEPVLPWMKSESRQSLGSRTSVDTTSLHVMKRQMPDPALFCYGLGIMLLALLTYFKFYLRADVVLVGERMILDYFVSDSCYRRRVSIHIAAGLRRYYAEQSPCAIYIQSILVAMLWSHCRYRLHGLSQKQMEYRR